MKTSLIPTALAALACAASSGVAVAQPYDNGGYDSEYQDYRAQRAEYDRQRAEYEAAQADYDRRYGSGAYSRRYGDGGDRSGYANGDGARYDQRSNYDCGQQRSANATAGGLIGAIAGAAIGSNISARGNRTEGAVLGAIVGGGAGVAIGRSSVSCDNTGYYYGYNQTYPYRESGYERGRRSGRYDSAYYGRQRCRLAVAPAEWNGRTDYRYVRVCPDRYGRYRITG